MISNLYLRVFTLFLLSITFSCQNNSQKDQTDNIYPSSSIYYSSKLIDSLSSLFIDSAKCDDCINEVYVDKINEDETYFTFKAKSFYKEYFEKNRPSYYLSIKGKTIFIFTGIETLITGNLKNTDTLNLKIISYKPYYLLMSFHMENNVVKLMKVASLPFAPRINQDVPNDSSFPKFNPSQIKDSDSIHP